MICFQTQVNWTHLIYYTTNQNIVPEAKVQVYFYDVLAKGLKNLEEHRQMPGKAILLHNALLGLYAYDLYHQVCWFSLINTRISVKAVRVL